MGIAGIPWWTTDIGGFHGARTDDPDFHRLYIRWFEYGCFCPVMRLHGNRNPQEGYGAEQIGGLDGWLCGYDLVVNTVPAPVLGETELKDLRPDCLIIDLASKPGGVDRKAADRLGRQVIWALSLPGKVAPVTAGGAIRSTIYNMLHELDV